ncbi:MAG: alpha-L-fucosidase, partial [Kiritimatiellae bacterium]|nr:alpha-L-fucosidase [Kiritimatiellia bacterium]
VKPQLRELLTGYGPVAILWFDTPGAMTVEESLDLRNFVKSIQPDCLVSGRIGNDLGDYGSMGDNIVPVGRIEGDWETPATLNDTWGYRSDDTNWKTSDSLIRLLADLGSKGVNYLLNVGPTSAGEIPTPSVELLAKVGDWMAVYGEAVYGTQAGPFSYEIPGLRMTSKRHSLFLFLMEDQTGVVRIHGLKNMVRGIVPLDRPARPIPFSQSSDNGIDRLEIDVPENGSPLPVRVLRLDLDGPPEADDTLLQQPDGSVTLPAFLADWRDAEGIRLEHNGMVRDWRKTGPSLVWSYRVGKPGRFRIEVCVHHCGDPGTFPRGMRMRVDNGVTPLEAELTPSGLLACPRNRYCPEVLCDVGTIYVPEPGMHTLCLKRISDGADPALITQVRLMPFP